MRGKNFYSECFIHILQKSLIFLNFSSIYFTNSSIAEFTRALNVNAPTHINFFLFFLTLPCSSFLCFAFFRVNRETSKEIKFYFYYQYFLFCHVVVLEHNFHISFFLVIYNCPFEIERKKFSLKNDKS
jgi:hypothetical protein